jgi:hypothetical protein
VSVFAGLPAAAVLKVAPASGHVAGRRTSGSSASVRRRRLKRRSVIVGVLCSVSAEEKVIIFIISLDWAPLREWSGPSAGRASRETAQLRHTATSHRALVFTTSSRARSACCVSRLNSIKLISLARPAGSLASILVSMFSPASSPADGPAAKDSVN